MKEQIEFLKKYCKFESYSCYVILAVARKKDNVNITNSQEVTFKEVLYKDEHIERKYSRIYNTCQNYKNVDGEKLNFYIYLSVNPRDTKKCYWKFVNELMSIGEELTKDIQKESQLARLDKRWLSVLMKPECKFSRNMFMLDVDTKDKDKINQISEIIGKVTFVLKMYKRETKNGWHLITKPFNKKEFTDLIDMVEVKTDDLLFLTRIEK